MANGTESIKGRKEYFDNVHNCRNDDDWRSIFPFLDLPKELRLQIYSYLARKLYKPIDTVRAKRLPYWIVTVYPASLLVCRAIVAEAMDAANNHKEPVAIFCRPNQHQKYCMLQRAIQRGYEMDLAQRAKTQMHPLVISFDIVEAAVQLFIQKIPFGEKKNIARLPERLLSLRHFFVQTLIRLRRMEMPELYLTVVVKLRGYRRFYNAYGSETCQRAMRWKHRDVTEMAHLMKKLVYAAIVSVPEKEPVHVRTMVTTTGKAEDVMFRHMNRWSFSHRSCVENIECALLEKVESRWLPGLPWDLFER